MAAHHELMPSMSSRPSASVRRTPHADTTGCTGVVAGIGAYGCQMCSRSKARSSSADMAPHDGSRLLARPLQEGLSGGLLADRPAVEPQVEQELVRLADDRTRLDAEDLLDLVPVELRPDLGELLLLLQP